MDESLGKNVLFSHGSLKHYKNLFNNKKNKKTMKKCFALSIPSVEKHQLPFSACHNWWVSSELSSLTLLSWLFILITDKWNRKTKISHKRQRRSQPSNCECSILVNAFAVAILIMHCSLHNVTPNQWEIYLNKPGLV